MTSPDRRKLGFREAAAVIERRHGPIAGRSLGVGRLVHILWYMTVGKRRFVPTGADPKRVRDDKKRARQNRRRNQHRR
jgi:hypothetical protein